MIIQLLLNSSGNLKKSNSGSKGNCMAGWRELPCSEAAASKADFIQEAKAYHPSLLWRDKFYLNLNWINLTFQQEERTSLLFYLVIFKN